MKVEIGDILKFGWIPDDLFIVVSAWNSTDGHCFVSSASKPLSTGNISIYANKSTKKVAHNATLADIIKKSTKKAEGIKRTKAPKRENIKNDKLPRYTGWPYSRVGMVERNPFLRGIPF